ncbi:MAG: PqiC family protein [Planctomycetota bacterium]|jgi:uncharacterized lipoprotein YmbA
MVRNFPRSLGLSLALGVLAVAAGCARTQPSRFFMLSPLAASTEAAEGPSDGGLAIGVGPVELPGHLDRPEIVTRTSDNELQLAEFHRWAEPLGDGITRVLADDLSILLPSDHVAVFPWSVATAVDYRVVVDIARFDGQLSERALLEARWTIVGEEGKKALVRGKSSFEVPTDGKGYEALVAAHSQTLADLAREMAVALRDVSQQSPGG